MYSSKNESTVADTKTTVTAVAAPVNVVERRESSPRKISGGAQAGRSSFEGRRNAAPSPMSPISMREASAQAYDRYPGATTDTMIVPAIAVQNDEPRLETLRESPEISPCSASGKLDWTTLTEGVSIAPRPSPTRPT